ncbi:Bis-ABC ATPase YheS [hydrothermal vent metagenome]|uniref:Bis-ABC ATPase YheS n=1 Tax=hydrothermal vent metagenome TaxID=652676 RepID=A0A3B0Z702_9ZZZZ
MLVVTAAGDRQQTTGLVEDQDGIICVDDVQAVIGWRAVMFQYRQCICLGGEIPGSVMSCAARQATITAMLQFREVALRRGTRLLFDSASLQIHPGQKVGLTGANGTGKSSLFSLLRGELHADSGDIQVPVDWQIASVAQELANSEQSAVEFAIDGDTELRQLQLQLQTEEAGNADGVAIAHLHSRLESVDGYTARSRASRLLHGLGFSAGDLERPVNAFSGGWRMRLNLAQALMCRSDLLLLDEPTNHLDLDAVIWLENWLRSYTGTLLLISHDRDFLDSVARQILHIEHQGVKLYSGNYSAFERVRSERLANQQAQYHKQQREVAHIQSYIERFRAKASKAKQAQSRIKALQRMQQIAPAHVDSPFHFSLLEPEKLPHNLLQLEKVGAGYDGTTILSGVRLSLVPGDRIGLLGPNGAGKSTLIKLFAGVLSPSGGEKQCARDLKIGYFAQHQVEQLQPQHSALEHIQQLDPQAREQTLLDYLGGFGFSGERASMLIAPFSGGEKSRLALALLVYQRPNLLLLDEPTNHLDLDMRQALAQALQAFSGAMVLVSHDRHLLRVCCDQLLLVHGGKVDEFPLSLDEYPQWMAEQQRRKDTVVMPNDGQNSATQRKQQKRDQAEQRKRQQPLREQVLKAEAALDKAHAEQAALQEQLADTDLYTESNKEALKAILVEKAQLDAHCDQLEQDWMEASEALEQMC